jgi:hypothetical protein
MRRLHPVAALRARYPRLGAAWRILVGAAPLALAAPAHADVTLPAPPPQVKPQPRRHRASTAQAPATIDTRAIALTLDDAVTEHAPPKQAQAQLPAVFIIAPAGVPVRVEPAPPPTLPIGLAQPVDAETPAGDPEHALDFIDATLDAGEIVPRTTHVVVKLPTRKLGAR